MLCVIYVITIGTLLGVIALLVERVLPPTWPRRWVWCAVIPLSIAVPGFYRSHHAWSIAKAFEQQATPTSSHVLSMTSLLPFDAAWWARFDSHGSIIGRLWLSASAVVLLWGLANAVRVWLVVRSARRCSDDADRPALVDGVRVVVTDGVGPATVGLLTSRVLLPRWVLALPGVQRRYVVQHEEEHRRAHDALLMFVASLTLLLMPWNVALWWHLRRLSLAIEMDCDNRVVGALGDAHAYGTLLLKVAQASSRGPRLQPALLGGMGMLERRLTALLEPTPLRHLQRFLLPAAAIALLALVLSMPHPVVGQPSHAHSTMNGGATHTP